MGYLYLFLRRLRSIFSTLFARWRRRCGVYRPAVVTRCCVLVTARRPTARYGMAWARGPQLPGAAGMSSVLRGRPGASSAAAISPFPVSAAFAPVSRRGVAIDFCLYVCDHAGVDRRPLMQAISARPPPPTRSLLQFRHLRFLGASPPESTAACYYTNDILIVAKLAETDEPIEMPFATRTCGCQKNYILGGGRDPPRVGPLFGYYLGMPCRLGRGRCSQPYSHGAADMRLLGPTVQ